MLKINTTLTILHLGTIYRNKIGNNKINQIGATTLAKALEINKTIINLSISTHT